MFFIGWGFQAAPFLRRASPWAQSWGCPTWPTLHLLFDLAVLSIWALRFNNARNSPGTCSYVFILISSPAVGSCTVESALTFLKQCVKEAGWVADGTMGLRGENNNLAWNSVYPQQHIECVQNERTPTSPLCLSHSFLSFHNLPHCLSASFSHSVCPNSQFSFSQNQYCTALFGSECNKVLCVQSQWEGVGYVSRRGKEEELFIMLISWWHCRNIAEPPGFNLTRVLTACIHFAYFFLRNIMNVLNNTSLSLFSCIFPLY